MKKSVIVVDLDGTLSKNNTFHAFVCHILRQSFKYFDWYLLLKIVFWSGLRAWKLVPHKRWKYEILKGVQNKNINLDIYVEDVNLSVNQFVLDKMKNFDYQILATAAPELYATKLAEKYQFTHCVATKHTPKYIDYSENIRLTKFKNVNKILEQCSVNEIDLLVTDHIDDAALIRFARKSWLVNADQKLKNFIKEHKLGHRVKYIDVNEK